jgi:hypothetical protein
MGPDETMQRDQELDLHRLRLTEYRIRFRLCHSEHISRTYRAFAMTHAGRRSPRTRAPPDPRLSSSRFRIDRNR